MSIQQEEYDYSDYEEEEDGYDDDSKFDDYEEFELGAKAKRCPKANAGIKSCVKKVKGGLSGMSNAVRR